MKHRLLTLLLSAGFVSFAHAEIAVHSFTRSINATTNTYDNGSTNSHVEQEDASSAAVGQFSESYEQTANLAYVQTHGSVSHQTTLTASADDLQFSGTLQLELSHHNQQDDTLGEAGQADLDFSAHFILDFDLTEAATFTLTASTSRSIQFNGWETWLSLSGPGLTTVYIGDATGQPDGPASVNLTGTLAANQGYRIEGHLRDVWNQHGGNVSYSDARRLNVAFQATTIPEPSSALLLLVGGLFASRRLPRRTSA